MRFSEIQQPLKEGSDILVRQPSEHARQEFYGAQTETLDGLVSLYNSNQYSRAPWKVAPARTLVRIWETSHKDGFVRDTKGLDKIAEIFYTNIVRLYVNTYIAEHTEASPDEELSEYFETDEEKEAFVDWAIETEKGWRISDYGFPRLSNLACLLLDCDNSEDKLLVCDAILNVAHQRSDLSSWFVEGGQVTLSMLSE